MFNSRNNRGLCVLTPSPTGLNRSCRARRKGGEYVFGLLKWKGWKRWKSVDQARTTRAAWSSPSFSMRSSTLLYHKVEDVAAPTIEPIDIFGGAHWQDALQQLAFYSIKPYPLACALFYRWIVWSILGVSSPWPNPKCIPFSWAML